jgi:helix-turn-helix protein
MADLDLDESHKKVLEILFGYKSMPFLELTSICDIDDKELEKIVSDLEQQDLIKVSNRGNIFEEVVTLKQKAFASRLVS